MTSTFDLLTLNFYSTLSFMCLKFKLCTEFKRNRISHGWIIDDLARFRRAILGVGHFYGTVLRGAWTKLHQTWRGHRAIVATLQICFRVLTPCCIFKSGWLKVEWCWKRCQISHFWTICENYGRVSEISGSIINEALPTTESPEYIRRPSTAWLLSAVYCLKMQEIKERKFRSVY